MNMLAGLNPFEFRAGLEQFRILLCTGGPVLIPLNSGLAWSMLAKEAMTYDTRLNPFEFRAGLERGTSGELFDFDRS